MKPPHGHLGGFNTRSVQVDYVERLGNYGSERHGRGHDVHGRGANNGWLFAGCVSALQRSICSCRAGVQARVARLKARPWRRQSQDRTIYLTIKKD